MRQLIGPAVIAITAAFWTGCTPTLVDPIGSGGAAPVGTAPGSGAFPTGAAGGGGSPKAERCVFEVVEPSTRTDSPAPRAGDMRPVSLGDSGAMVYRDPFADTPLGMARIDTSAWPPRFGPPVSLPASSAHGDFEAVANGDGTLAVATNHYDGHTSLALGARLSPDSTPALTPWEASPVSHHRSLRIASGHGQVLVGIETGLVRVVDGVFGTPVNACPKSFVSGMAATSTGFLVTCGQARVSALLDVNAEGPLEVTARPVPGKLGSPSRLLSTPDGGAWLVSYHDVTTPAALRLDAHGGAIGEHIDLSAATEGRTFYDAAVTDDGGLLIVVAENLGIPSRHPKQLVVQFDEAGNVVARMRIPVAPLPASRGYPDYARLLRSGPDFILFQAYVLAPFDTPGPWAYSAAKLGCSH